MSALCPDLAEAMQDEERFRQFILRSPLQPSEEEESYTVELVLLSYDERKWEEMFKMPQF